MQNITNCDANGGNTQHHFREIRGRGHDKSAPTAACGLRTYSYIVFFLLLYCLFGANWVLLCEWLNVYFALFWGSTSLYSTLMWNSGVMLMHCCSKSSSM